MKKKADKFIRLEGIFCSLIPITEKDLPLVVELRNREKNKYFLNQSYDLSIEMQKEWYQEYLKRENDIYWGIWDHNRRFIGTIRLYNIESEICEEGSCIVDENFAKEAPYALEAKYLLTQYAFQTLGMKQMVNKIRHDNKVMNSLARQQGFCIAHKIDLDGAEYIDMILDVDRFAADRISRLLDNWKARCEYEKR